MTEEIRRKMQRLDELVQKKETTVLSNKEVREFVFLKQQAERRWQPSATTQQRAIIKELDGVRAELDVISRMTASKRSRETTQEKKKALKKKLDTLKNQRDGLDELIIEEKACFEAELGIFQGVDTLWDVEDNL